jgi:hypothetical protein
VVMKPVTAQIAQGAIAAKSLRDNMKTPPKLVSLHLRIVSPGHCKLPPDRKALQGAH